MHTGFLTLVVLNFHVFVPSPHSYPVIQATVFDSANGPVMDAELGGVNGRVVASDHRGIFVALGEMLPSGQEGAKRAIRELRGEAIPV